MTHSLENGVPPPSAVRSDQPAVETPAGAPQPERGGFAVALRRHWLFALLLAVGATLRVLATLAYRPALLDADSTSYLRNSLHPVPEALRPAGYAVFLAVLDVRQGVLAVPIAQHLLVLGMCVLVYALLLRRGLPGWGAALAVGPVLVDPYQLDLEQFILSDALFEVLLVVGIVLLLWWRRPPWWTIALSGVLFAFAAIDRNDGEAVVVVVALALLLFEHGRRRILAPAVLLLAFVLPMAGYMAEYDHEWGSFSVTGYAGHFLAARVEPFADCTGLALPAYERVLCPTAPPADRPGTNVYLWHTNTSPLYRVVAPPGQSTDHVLKNYAERIILHQPLTYAKSVGYTFIRDFWPTHTDPPGNPDIKVSSLQFQLTYPQIIVGGLPADDAVLKPYGGEKVGVYPPLARILHDYERFFSVPATLLGACLVVALLAVLGVGRTRRSGVRAGVLMLAGSTVVVLVTSAATSVFTWRYVLPELALLPPAAALAVAAFAGRLAYDPAEDLG